MNDRAHTGMQARILVAEDNAAAAESLSKLLELFGHEVRVAADAPTTIAAALD